MILQIFAFLARDRHRQEILLRLVAGRENDGVCPDETALGIENTVLDDLADMLAAIINMCHVHCKSTA